MFKISASVGKNAVNRAADVLVVQKALNLIPTTRGGPVARLVEDSMVGEYTIGAISRFQQWAFGWADGKIDAAAQTIEKLIEEGRQAIRLAEPLFPIIRGYLTRLQGDAFATAVLEDLKYLSPFRLAVLTVALAEMVPAPNGAVNDVAAAPPDTNPASGMLVPNPRFGWRRLEQYVDGGFPTLRPTVKREEFYRGLIERNARIEMGGPPGTSNKLHWCGVFCAWVYRQRAWLTPFVPPGKALRDVEWKPGRLSMPTSKLSWKLDYRQYQIRPGDVCHQPKAKNTHHFIVLTSVADGKFWTINSNGMNQSNQVKQWDLKTVEAWYSADDFLV
jgi:hypothetical protein